MKDYEKITYNFIYQEWLKNPTIGNGVSIEFKFNNSVYKLVIAEYDYPEYNYDKYFYFIESIPHYDFVISETLLGGISNKKDAINGILELINSEQFSEINYWIENNSEK